jgi:sugar fermentation stimulation protein A
MRLLADVELEETGEVVTAHCPNPGAMLGLKEPGLRVWLERNDDPRKKLDWGWRLCDLPDGHRAGIDTGVPNRIVGEALVEGRIPALAGAGRVRAEVAYGTRSRVDFLIEGARRTFVEVKNVHLRRQGDIAEFPDCVTERGARHLRELMEVVRAGDRAVMLYVVQRTDCARLKMAADLDPGYAQAFDAARAAGVEMLCHGTEIGVDGVWLAGPLPVDAGTQTARPSVSG